MENFFCIENDDETSMIEIYTNDDIARIMVHENDNVTEFVLEKPDCKKLLDFLYKWTFNG